MSAQPKDRAPEVEDARSLYFDMASDQASRQDEFKGILGQYEKNPPFDPEELREMGRPGASNFNSGEFRGQIDSAVRNAFQIETKLKISAKWETTHGESFERHPWMDDWAQLYHELIHKKWKNHPYRTWLYIKERALHGHGPTYFHDPMVWWDKPIPAYSLMVPVGASADPDEWPFFMIVDTLPVYELIELFEQRRKSADDRKKKGPKVEAHRLNSWNLDQVKAAIESRSHANGKDEYIQLDSLDPENICAQPESITIQDFHSVVTGNGIGIHDEIPVTYYYFRDYDGTWVEKIFTHTHGQGADQDGKNSNAPDGYLFEEKLEGITCASDIILTNPYEIGFFHHEIKGLGGLVSGPTMWRDVLLNRTVDNVFMQMSLVLQSMNERSHQKHNKIKFDWDTIEIPPEFDVVQQRISGDINAALTLADRIAYTNDHNTTNLVNASLMPQNTKTARQHNSEEAQALDLQDHEVEFYRLWMSRAHAARMKRIIHIRKELNLPIKDKERVDALDRRHPGTKALNDILIKAEEVGIPMEAIDAIDPDSTVAYTGISIQKIMFMQQFAQETPRGRQWLLENVAISVLGIDEASRGFGIYDRDGGADPKMGWTLTDCQREHGTFAQGYQVVPAEYESHIEASEFHLRHAQEIAGRYMQAPENPASTSNDPNSVDAQVANELPNEITGLLDLEDKLQMFKELSMLFQHNMSKPSAEGGFMGHLAYVEMMSGMEERKAKLFAGWNEVWSVLQKLENEVSEQSQAEVARIRAQAQQPQMSPVDMAKVQAEQMKSQMRIQDHQIDQQIKIERHQLDQQLESEKHESDERGRQANRDLQNARRSARSAQEKQRKSFLDS